LRELDYVGFTNVKRHAHLTT